jgi:O-antigen ligase
LRAHNQFLTIAIATGIPGLIVFLALLFYPVFRYRKKMILVYRSFFIIAALSFMWEDTLETQAGIFFVAFFTVCLYNVQQLMEHRYAYLAGMESQPAVTSE